MGISMERSSVKGHELAYNKVLLRCQRNSPNYDHYQPWCANEVETYLLIEPLHPPIQILYLLSLQVTAIVKWPIEVFREHFFIKALACQSASGIPASEVLVGPARAVEVAAGRDVVDLAYRN